MNATVEQLRSLRREMYRSLLLGLLILAVAAGVSLYRLGNDEHVLHQQAQVQQDTCASRAKARLVVRDAITVALAPRPGENLTPAQVAQINGKRDQLLVQLPPIDCSAQ